MANSEARELLKKQIDNLKAHIKVYKADSSSSIRVLENVGEFAFVVKFDIFNDYDLNLTLQICNDLQLVNSTLIVNVLKQEKCKPEKLEDLKRTLDDFLKSIKDNDLVRFFEKSRTYIDTNFDRIKRDSSPKKGAHKNSKAKSSTVTSEETEAENTKKSSMKTAGDVINRIQWDAGINKDYITVGYLDRFLGLKECEFNTFDWGDIVCADLGSLAIPEHRICYFKYKNEIVWDKSQRRDDFFGSTGSNVTIHDVIKRLEGKSFTKAMSLVDADDDETQNKLGRVNGKNFKSDPNYFISIPLNNSELRKNFTALKDELVQANKEVENYILPETSLHLTLCTLRIENDDEMNIVKQVMNDVLKNQNFLSNNFPINIKFQGLGEFYNKVLYINCLSEELSKLENVKQCLLKALEEKKVNTAGNYYDFLPHLTVLKIKNDQKKPAKNQHQMLVKDIVNKNTWSQYENFLFGSQSIKEIELCKMLNIFNCGTYPVDYTVNID